MSNTLIQIEDLSKKYVIRHNGAPEGLRHALEDLAKAPFRWLRKTPDVGTRNGKAHGFSEKLKAKPSRLKASEDFWALKNVSFEVKQGEVVGIIGRNGAGKSTLLKILSRITEPTKGRVRITGRVASLLEVGTGFHPELTGRENIFLNGAILGMSRAEIRRKFDAIVNFAEVERFLDTPVKRYSSGMYVRLAFAVAAHLEPEILIVDEVLAVGDAEFQKKCLGKMSEVSREGRTVLFVSHNLAAITRLTTRCVYLVKGEARFIGKTNEAVLKYTESGQEANPIYLDQKFTGEDEPRISRVQLDTTLPGNIHINHSPLAIRIELYTPEPISGACLTVQIFDMEQVNYVILWTQDVDLPMCRKPGMHLLKCVIPQLHLFMGNYRLRVFLSEPPGGRTLQVLDGVCPFEVVMRDNSRLYQWNAKECAYVENYHWESHFLEERR
jgi:lipopolysaccharide transport system ATP-binding protein